jgi:hypothetical protein
MATRQTTRECLPTTKIGEKGQLTVAKQFRQDLGRGTGAPFELLRLRDGLVLLPEQQRFDHVCEKVSWALTSLCLTPEDMFATLPQARQRIFARRHDKHAQSTKPSGRNSGRQREKQSPVKGQCRIRLFLDSNVFMGESFGRGV